MLLPCSPVSHARLHCGLACTSLLPFGTAQDPAGQTVHCWRHAAQAAALKQATDSAAAEYFAIAEELKLVAANPLLARRESFAEPAAGTWCQLSRVLVAALAASLTAGQKLRPLYLTTPQCWRVAVDALPPSVQPSLLDSIRSSAEVVGSCCDVFVSANMYHPSA